MNETHLSKRPCAASVGSGARCCGFSITWPFMALSLPVIVPDESPNELA